MKDIDELLSNYEPGLPKNKPDVLKQTEEIEKKRVKLEENAKNQYLNEKIGITIENNGKRVNLTRGEVLSIFDSTRKEIEMLQKNAMKTNIELPSGESKYMDFFELSKTCQDLVDKVKVQNKLIENMKNQIKILKEES